MFITRRRRSFISGGSAPVANPVEAPTITGSPTLLYSWDFADNSKISKTGVLIDSIAGSDGTLMALGNTGTNRPALTVTSENFQAASFSSATQQFLFSNGLTQAPGWSFCVIVKMTNVSGTQRILEKSAGASAVSFDRDMLLLVPTVFRSQKCNAASSSFANSTTANANLHCITGVSKQAAAGTVISLDGITPATGGATADSVVNQDYFLIGASRASNAFTAYANMSMCRVLVYSTELSNAQLEEIAVWANTNYGTPNLA